MTQTEYDEKHVITTIRMDGDTITVKFNLNKLKNEFSIEQRAYIAKHEAAHLEQHILELFGDKARED